jgi:hypothetical protein
MERPTWLLPVKRRRCGFDRNVAGSHFWETLGFSLVFGALAGWLPFRRNYVEVGRTEAPRAYGSEGRKLQVH